MIVSTKSKNASVFIQNNRVIATTCDSNNTNISKRTLNSCGSKRVFQRTESKLTVIVSSVSVCVYSSVLERETEMCESGCVLRRTCKAHHLMSAQVCDSIPLQLQSRVRCDLTRTQQM